MAEGHVYDGEWKVDERNGRGAWGVKGPECASGAVPSTEKYRERSQQGAVARLWRHRTHACRLRPRPRRLARPPPTRMRRPALPCAPSCISTPIPPATSPAQPGVAASPSLAGLRRHASLRPARATLVTGGRRALLIGWKERTRGEGMRRAGGRGFGWPHGCDGRAVRTLRRRRPGAGIVGASLGRQGGRGCR